MSQAFHESPDHHCPRCGRSLHVYERDSDDLFCVGCHTAVALMGEACHYISSEAFACLEAGEWCPLERVTARVASPPVAPPLPRRPSSGPPEP